MKAEKKHLKSSFRTTRAPASALAATWKRKSLHVVTKVERNKKHRRQLLWLALWAGLTVALAGCGRQAFVVGTSSLKVSAGTFTIPAKVDILLAEDDSGSIKEIYPSIASQTTSFLSKLENNKAWDYHFATIPLTSDRNITQVVGSKYDSNWGSQWLSPYPGAVAGAPGTITATAFRTLLNYSGFLTQTDLNSFNNGQEPGFEKIRKTLYDSSSGSNGTNFLRPDALLVLIVMSNGNDTSGVTYCQRSDGYLAPAEQLSAGSILPGSCTKDGVSVPYAQTAASSLAYYQAQFQNIKLFPGMTKLFSVVSQQTLRGYPYDYGCLGGPAYLGTRYNQMAATLGGGQYNICQQSVGSVLDQLASQLQSTRLGFRQRYVTLAQEPNVNTIKVTKFLNGDTSQSANIPQDANNGWTYVGLQNNVPLIDWPTNMNNASGYMIELHGSAKLIGDDSIDVQFKPAGVSNSATP